MRADLNFRVFPDPVALLAPLFRISRGDGKALGGMAKAMLAISMLVCAPAIAAPKGHEDRCAIAAGERLPKIPGLEVKRLKLEEIDRGDGYVAYAGQIEAAAMARSLRWAFTCGVRSDGMTDIVRLKLIE